MSEHKDDMQNTITRSDALRLLAECKQLAEAGEHVRAYERLFQEIEQGDEPLTLLDKLDYLHEHEAALEVLLLLASEASSGVLTATQQGFVATGLGTQYRSLGQHETEPTYYPKAEEQLTRALGLLEASGSQEACADVLVQMAAVAIEQGHDEAGFAALQQALARYQQSGKRKRFAMCVYTIGWAHHKAGQHQKAADYFARSIELSRQIPYPLAEGMAQRLLGDTYFAMRTYRQAIVCYRQAIAAYPADATFDVALSHYMLAYAYLYDHSLWQALTAYEQAQDLLTQISNPMAAICANTRGTIYGRMGQRQKRMECHQQALALVEKYGKMQHKAEVIRSIGEAYRDLGQYNEAIEHYHQALSLYRRAAMANEEANTHNYIGDAYEAQDKHQAAIEAYKQALAMWQELAKVGKQAASLNSIGNVYRSMGEWVLALEHYQQALPLYDKLNDRKGRAATMTNMAIAYQNLKRWREALQYHLRSFTS